MLDRRSFLTGLVGCSVAASPLMTPLTFASAPWDTRLVVILLRGGMDGLEVVQPWGDPDYAALRGMAGRPDTLPDLDGFFALNAGLKDLYPLWQQGELSFAHATSTPYRDRRSHFDGQDLLEAGTEDLGQGTRDGWLNRMLQVVPGVEARTAFAIGREELLLTRGAAPVSDWSPDIGLELSGQARRLLELVMHDDPLFQHASAEAIDIAKSVRLAMEDGGEDMSARDMMMMAGQTGQSHRRIAEFAATQLKGDTRIATFSLGGWDTHANQRRSVRRALGHLSDTILTLRDQTGPDVWGKTAVIALTEFGRTARLNGSQGTDHGTGGAIVMAGGALRKGQVVGRWPGLAEADLYARRDLKPTRDARAYAAWLMRDLFGIERTILEQSIFPGLDMGQSPALIS